jgi:hypothetical protein
VTLFPVPAPQMTVAFPAPSETPWTLDRLGAPAVAFVVYGEPAPQGSKSFKGFRKSRAGGSVPILVESSAGRVNRWRDDVVAAFLRIRPPGWVRLAEDNRDGVVVDMVFTKERPAALPKKRISWPGAAPDLDKLARSTGDALTSAGAYSDDARVVAYRRLDKTFVGSDDPDCLPQPGAIIRVWALRGSTYDVPPTLRRPT